MISRLKTFKRVLSLNTNSSDSDSPSKSSYSETDGSEREYDIDESLLEKSAYDYGTASQKELENTGSQRSLFEELWASGAWRIMPLLFLIGIAASMIAPGLPNYCTDFFASTTMKRKEICESYEPGESPEWCVNAHWQCTQYQSFWDMLNHSFFGFFIVPILGKLSDRYGRKYFLLLTTFFGILPCFAIYLMAEGYGNFKIAYPFLSFGAAMGPFAICLAYVSDCTSKRYRTQAMGMVIGLLLVGLIVGPMITDMDVRKANLVSCIIATIAMVYCLAIPESLHMRKEPISVGDKSSYKQTLSLFKSRHFVKLSVIACLGSMVAEGAIEINGQYFSLISGFTVNDQAHLITLIGTSGLVYQFLILPFLLPRMPEKHLLITCNSILMLTNVGMAFLAYRKDFAMILQALSMIGVLSFALSTGMLSKASDDKHQGLVTGVISGLRAQSMGISPVIYSFLFKQFGDTKNNLPYFPGACYIFSAVSMSLATAMVFFVDPSDQIQIEDDEDDF